MKYKFPCMDCIGSFPHTSMCVHWPGHIVWLCACCANGVTESFASVHMQQSGFSESVSTVKPSTSFSLNILSRPWYLTCPYLQCQISQLCCLSWHAVLICSDFEGACRILTAISYNLLLILFPVAIIWPLAVFISRTPLYPSHLYTFLSRHLSEIRLLFVLEMYRTFSRMMICVFPLMMDMSLMLPMPVALVLTLPTPITHPLLIGKGLKILNVSC